MSEICPAPCTHCPVANRQKRLLSETWNDEGNDIIALTRKMCMVLVEVGAQTRREEFLLKSADVVRAVEVIALYGEQITYLLNYVSKECPPNNQATRDLVAYTHKIVLSSHQLRFATKLRAEDQMIGGETFLTKIDSDDSLVDIARGLVNYVIMAVRVCCVASTKRKPKTSSSNSFSSSSSFSTMPSISISSNTSAKSDIRSSSSTSSSSSKRRLWSINDSFFDDVFL